MYDIGALKEGAMFWQTFWMEKNTFVVEWCPHY